jgi:hypothetical protein
MIRAAIWLRDGCGRLTVAVLMLSSPQLFLIAHFDLKSKNGKQLAEMSPAG